MESFELRTGNIIKRKSNGNWCTVNWGIIKDFELNDDISDYEPIKLTKDILEDFKFEYLPWEKFLDFTHMIFNGITLRLHNKGCSVFNISECNYEDRQYIEQVLLSVWEFGKRPPNQQLI